jgi:hypothetical protein
VRKDAALVFGMLEVVVTMTVQLKAINAMARGTSELRAKGLGEAVKALVFCLVKWPYHLCGEQFETVRDNTALKQSLRLAEPRAR